MHFEEALIHTFKELTMAITQLNADIATLNTNVQALIARARIAFPKQMLTLRTLRSTQSTH